MYDIKQDPLGLLLLCTIVSCMITFGIILPLYKLWEAGNPALPVDTDMYESLECPECETRLVRTLENPDRVWCDRCREHYNIYDLM